jgi:hypothetical protein
MPSKTSFFNQSGLTGDSYAARGFTEEGDFELEDESDLDRVHPWLSLYKNAANGGINSTGQIHWYNNNAANEKIQLGNLWGYVLDDTDGSEDSWFGFNGRDGGVSKTTINWWKGVVVGDGAWTSDDKGNGTLNAMNGLYVAGNPVAVTNAVDGGLTLTDTDAGAGTGPKLDLFRDSASPAASDIISSMLFSGRSSTGVKRPYGEIYGAILDPTNGSEDSDMVIANYVGGTWTKILQMATGLRVGTPTGGDKGAGTINAAGNIYVNGDPVPSMNASSGKMEITWADDGSASGPDLSLYRNSTSPAASDWIGIISFDGEDSASTKIPYAEIRGRIDDPTAAADDGRLVFQTRRAGGNAARAIIANGLQVGSPTGGDKGAGTINAAGNIYVNDDIVPTKVAVPSTATSTGVTGQVAFDSTHAYFCTATNTWRRTTIASW